MPSFSVLAHFFSHLVFLAVVLSLFVFHQQSNLIYLLLYVDDIIVTGNNSSLIDSFTCKLHSEFATKDLGSLSYFLGLEASPTLDGLFISQLKYARDILTRAQLLDSKPIHTPMVVSQHLTADGSPFSDPTLYKSLVGALQYFTITRPDISYAINSVSQFLHAPTADHFLAVKHILRYVRGTLHFGLTFRPSTVPSHIFGCWMGWLSWYSSFYIRLVMSHIGWGGEQTTIYKGIYKGVETFTNQTRFKALRGSPKGKAQRG